MSTAELLVPQAPVPFVEQQDRVMRYSASDVRDVVAGNWQGLFLWKTGKAERPDLSRRFPVQLGKVTEPFNLAWLGATREIDIFPMPVEPMTEHYRTYKHPASGNVNAERGRYSCRPDGMFTANNRLHIVECKHTDNGMPIEARFRFWMPQVHVSMFVTGVDRCILSVIWGANRLTAYSVDFDREYWRWLEEWVDLFDGHLALDSYPEKPSPAPVEDPAMPMPAPNPRWNPHSKKEKASA